MARMRPGAPGYDEYKAKQAEISRKRSLAGRDIGKIPKIKNRARRRRCADDLRSFLLEYFPEAFPLPFSADHDKAILKTQSAVIHGGTFALAMPRGSGKSTILERAALWAMLYGRRRFVMLISAEAGLARVSLASILSELENNESLGQDFPEVCYPIRKLDGIHQRASGQLYRGRRTCISMSEDEIVLPTIPKAKASGATVNVAGITGRIRGTKRTTNDGTIIRPDLVLVDDPQTAESARSVTQCDQRERVIKADVLGLAGPGKRIAGLAAVTVIRKDDLADRLLSRDRNPQWQGERTQTIYRWADAESLWREYVELRRQAQRDYDGSPAEVQRVCNEFYTARRAEMDAGAVVAWEHRKEEDDVSALQHAWNVRADRGDAAFAAEYQNDPLPELELTEEQLSVEEVAKKINGIDRRVLPVSAQHLTAFVDVQQKVLWWVVAAWDADFSGHVVDYGTEPDQGVEYVATSEIRNTLQDAAPSAGLEGFIYAGLERLVSRLMSTGWRRDDGATVRIDRILIDANWGQSTDVVYRFCRQAGGAPVLPSHGRYVGAASKPLNEYTKKPGDRVGLHWRIPVVTSTKRTVRHVLFDANWWKSFVRARLKTPMGDPGCLSLWGRKDHRLFADHFCAEFSVKTQGRGRQVDEWKIRAPNLDNHFLDGITGCAVAASMCGAELFGLEAPRRRVAGPKRTLGELTRR